MIFSKNRECSIILKHGIGNKLNFIYNTLNIPNAKYYWLNNYECMANHDDLFDFSQCGINIQSITPEEKNKIKDPYELKGFFIFKDLKTNV